MILLEDRKKKIKNEMKRWEKERQGEVDDIAENEIFIHDN
jgi:hypothetical protein